MLPNLGTTYLRIAPKDLRRGFAVKTAMRPFGIIENSVFLYHLLCLGKVVKEISVKAFISELAVEALKTAVLPRAAFFSELMANSVLLNEFLKNIASELRPLVGSDDFGSPVDSEEFLKNLYNLFCGHAELDFDGGTEPAEEIFNSHKLEGSAVCKVVKDEIQGPDMHARQGVCQRRCCYSQLFVLPGLLLLKVKALIDAIDFLEINGKAELVYGIMDSSVAVKSVGKRNIPDSQGKDRVFFIPDGSVIQCADRTFEKLSGFSCCNAKLNHLMSNHSPFVDGQKFF
jgi:hypothetical protein